MNGSYGDPSTSRGRRRTGHEKSVSILEYTGYVDDDIIYVWMVGPRVLCRVLSVKQMAEENDPPAIQNALEIIVECMRVMEPRLQKNKDIQGEKLSVVVPTWVHCCRHDTQIQVDEKPPVWMAFYIPNTYPVKQDDVITHRGFQTAAFTAFSVPLCPLNFVVLRLLWVPLAHVCRFKIHFTFQLLRLSQTRQYSFVFIGTQRFPKMTMVSSILERRRVFSGLTLPLLLLCSIQKS